MVQLSQIKIYPLISSHLYTSHPRPHHLSPRGATYGIYISASILLKLGPQLRSRAGSRAVSEVEDCVGVSSYSSIHPIMAQVFHPPRQYSPIPSTPSRPTPRATDREQKNRRGNSHSSTQSSFDPPLSSAAVTRSTHSSK